MMKRLQTILVALLLVSWTGMAAGKDKSPRVEQNLSIFNDVMRQVDMWYVDTLNYEALTETAINAMLKQIDPYTVYIPARKNETVKMSNELPSASGITVAERIIGAIRSVIPLSKEVFTVLPFQM